MCEKNKWVKVKKHGARYFALKEEIDSINLTLFFGIAFEVSICCVQEWKVRKRFKENLWKLKQNRIWDPVKYRRWHCVKSVRVWSFSISLRISPYSVRMRENTDQKNSKYWHFSHSVVLFSIIIDGYITLLWRIIVHQI